MYTYRDKTQIPLFFMAAHVLSIILIFMKLFGAIIDLDWWIVAFPFILDAIIVLWLILGAIVLFFVSTIFDRK